MKSINYLILGVIIALIGMLVTCGENDIRYLLISLVGFVFCTIAIIKVNQETHF